ncbi:MAG: HlyD family type I secretion periplasmic adaptor subunit [Salaquimonas sp.]|nr:HlyD family type I secretion periplasmic adaptor subunit [Salaquimonas sp.]
MSGRGALLFANDVRTAREKDLPRTAAMLVIVLAAMIAGFITWSRVAVLDEVTSGTGKVVPAQQIQVVQSLEGGIVSEILVHEGEQVEKDQVLMRLDETSQGSRLGELSGQRYAGLARIARLSAEAEGKDAPEFSERLKIMAPDLIEAETEAFQSRQHALEGQRKVLEPQLEQRREDLVELQQKQKKLTQSLELLERELKLTRDLADSGAVPELDLIRLERDAVEARGDLDETAARMKRTQAAIKEYENRLASLDADFRASARVDLAKEMGSLKVIGESITGAEGRVERTTIRAPMRGVVNRIAVTTIGGVIQPGGAALEIVPLDDKLVIEAAIRPQDVAFIRVGQEANVKLSAYDYTIYGSLKGKVTQVGANTLTNPQSGEPFYRVVIETESTTLEHRGAALDIIPGMVATVDIKTGSRTVFDYLIQPLNRVRHEALRER